MTPGTEMAPPTELGALQILIVVLTYKRPQDLPDALRGGNERIDKLVGSRAEIADAPATGERRGVQQDTTLAHKNAPICDFIWGRVGHRGHLHP